MTPTVLRDGGYRVMIFPNDHPPAHVHVIKAEKNARVRLEPTEILHNFGFVTREIGEVLRLVAENQADLLEEWDTIHPEQ